MFLVCGEALYDLFMAGDGVSSDVQFDGRIGGSPFNVAIGMARLGASTALFTGISTDTLGARLIEALEGEGVSTEYLIRTDRRTTLSVVGLDASGSPSYTFYGADSADCSIVVDDLPALESRITGLHLGSYSIAVSPVADALAAFVEREKHRFVSLDPNVRPTVEPDMGIWRTRIDALRRQASLIKVSAEDLAILFPGADPVDIVQEWARGGPELVVLTDGGNAGVAIRGSDCIRFVPPRTQVVDTVGAGDAFQASLLASLAASASVRRGILSAMTIGDLEAILTRASHAASITCERRGADLPRLEDLR